MADRKALGKGLSALLPSRAQATSHPEVKKTPHEEASSGSGLLKVPILDIHPNPLQPRTVFEQDRLDELAQSIRANGVIQPLVVQKVENGYQLVAGERRWRAAQLAGLTHVPTVVQEFASDRLLEVALIETFSGKT
jgi:ParB family chromosome partitioning protein